MDGYDLPLPGDGPVPLRPWQRRNTHCGLPGHTGGIQGQSCMANYWLRNMQWRYNNNNHQRIQFGVSGIHAASPIHE